MDCNQVMRLALIIASCFLVIDSLKEGDYGACKQIQNLPKNLPEKFNKAKRCPAGYKECTPKERKELGNFDPKKFRCCYKRKTVKTEFIACCDGYEYKNGSCHAICIPACEHGTCIAPDLCQCDQLFSWHDKKCVPSVCDPTCGANTICTNDTCSCVADTIRFNSTHCTEKCDAGYVTNKLSLLCEPHCDSGCQNGTCASPNNCTCNDGYERKNNSCTPICEHCNNGHCSAPKVCNECLEGYNKINNLCVPVCSNCEHGICIAPNDCQCQPNYKKHEDGSCVPVCSNCEHGDCIAPNDCQCQPNYGKHENGSCVPVCTEGCVNADCTAPDICTCHFGYKMDPHNRSVCQPICSPECINATCVLPNSCTCFEGYETTMNKWTCAPICDDGYVRNASYPYTCYKPCNRPCEHGICTLNGECKCRGGYELINDTCSPLPPVDCSSCLYNCSDSECRCQDGRACISGPEVGAEVSSTGLAAVELSWGLGGAVVVLLLVLVMGVMFHLYKRKRTDTKATTSDTYGSVVYTVPDTLLTQRCPNLEETSEAIEAYEANAVNEANECEAPQANARLLSEKREPYN